MMTAEVYKKLKNGDPIGDTELSVAIVHLTPTVDLLSKLGPEFHFTWKELYFTLVKLKEIQSVRNDRGEKR